MWRNRKFSATRLNRGEILGTEDFSSVDSLLFQFFVTFIRIVYSVCKVLANAKAALPQSLRASLRSGAAFTGRLAAPATDPRWRGPGRGCKLFNFVIRAEKRRRPGTMPGRPCGRLQCYF